MKKMAAIVGSMVVRVRRAGARAAMRRSQPAARHVSVRWLVAALAVTVEIGAFVAWVRRPRPPTEEPAAA